MNKKLIKFAFWDSVWFLVGVTIGVLIHIFMTGLDYNTPDTLLYEFTLGFIQLMMNAVVIQKFSVKQHKSFFIAGLFTPQIMVLHRVHEFTPERVKNSKIYDVLTRK